MDRENLSKKTRRELVQLARQFNIRGRTTMRKRELIAALLDAYSSGAKPPALQAGAAGRAAAGGGPVVEATSQPAQAATSPMRQPSGPPPAPPPELPPGYGDNRIVLLVRDPYWVFAYWEIQPERSDAARAQLGDAFDTARWILRVYDVTDVEFDGSNAHSSFDIELVDTADNWYIKVPSDDRHYCVDIGVRALDGRFVVLARSSPVQTPRAGISGVIDEAWMSREREFERIYALSGGAGPAAGSLEMREMMESRLRHLISSPGVSSFVGSGRR